MPTRVPRPLPPIDHPTNASWNLATIFLAKFPREKSTRFRVQFRRRVVDPKKMSYQRLVVGVSASLWPLLRWIRNRWSVVSIHPRPPTLCSKILVRVISRNNGASSLRQLPADSLLVGHVALRDSLSARLTFKHDKAYQRVARSSSSSSSSAVEWKFSRWK